MMLGLGSGLIHAAKPPIYTSKDNNLAVGGYDPVAYFKNNLPRRGKKIFQHEYKGAIWQFSSRKNQKDFSANPEKYVPQFGGYCSFSVAQGSAIKGLPQHWVITDGKLYLNRSHPIHERWLLRKRILATRAHKNWPYVLEGQVESLFRPANIPATQ
jgi:YHS domain-containing protein